MKEKMQMYKRILDDMKRCKPYLDAFYRGEIRGTELYAAIQEKAHTMNEPGFEEFISQINKPEFLGPWTLPWRSSGSFYTAFFDMDFMANDEDISEEDFRELVAYSEDGVEFENWKEAIWNSLKHIKEKNI